MSQPHKDPPARVLAVHRYFWPDTPPYAVMLRTIAAHWAEAGHEVEVLSSQPSYKAAVARPRMPERETLDGFSVRRVRMRPDAGPRARKLRNMVRFSLIAFVQVLLGRRRDVVMCSTAPQVLLGWFVSLASRFRGARFIYHCMDLHPEIGRLSGEFANPIVYRLMMRLDLATCRRASAIVVLSDDMRDALLARDRNLATRVVVLNNFDLPTHGELVPADLPSFEGITVAFTGNVGRYQGLEAVAEAVLGDASGLEKIRLVLMGEGAAKPAVEALVAAAAEERRNRVLLLPHGSVEQARAVMRVADMGLVSLEPEVIRFAYPSKTATYLSEGLPILAGVEPDSALARDIENWGVGGLIGRSPASVRAALLGWVDRRDELGQLRHAARKAWNASFSAERKLNEWDQLLQCVLQEGR